ncbi:MAG: triose-phosphate isomerase [Gammaproteobacteria bacterium]|nr:triose-phosphate isomerase [Gammaproteobacteria bacterium]
MRPTLIAGNWKMNGSRSSVEELVVGIREEAPFECQVLLIPPFVFLDRVSNLLAGSEIQLGAQDVDPREDDAVTGGDVSRRCCVSSGLWVCAGRTFGAPDAVRRVEARLVAAKLAGVPRSRARGRCSACGRNARGTGPR